MRKLLTLFTALLFVGSMWGEKITNVANIESGKKYYIGATKSDNSDWYLSVANHGTAGTGLQGTAVSTTSDAEEFTFTQVTGGWTIQFNNDNYLSLASSKANGKVDVVEDAAVWVITETAAGKLNLKINNYCLQRNTGSSLNFGSYGSGQLDVWLEVVPVISAVTITNPAHGIVSVKNGDATISSETPIAEGAELSVSIADVAGYRFTLKAYKTGDESTEVEINNGKITMPDYPITITADELALFNVAVAVNDANMGSATINGGASVYVADDTELLTLAASANTGYEFVDWTYDNEKVALDADDDAETTGYASAAATITANFKVSTTPTIEVSETALDWGSVAVGTALAGKTFTITGLNLTANVTLAWDGEGDDAFTYEVTTGSLTPTDGAVSATITVTPKVSAVGSYVNELTVSSTGATSQAVDAALTILQTYTAKWFINSTTIATQTQTAVAGTALMASPDDFSEFTDCSDLTFMGWAEAPIATTQQSAPTYTSKTEMPEADVNFYAVFATKNVDIIKTTTNIAYSGSSTNMSGNNDAATFGLDAEQWSVVGAKGSANINVGLNTDGTIRLYYNAGGSNTLTITAPATIDSVSIDFVDGKANGWVKVGGVSVAAVNGKYPINATSFVIGNANTSSAQVHMTNIAVIVLNEDVSYSDYLTTCPHCETVTLVKAGETNGTFVLKNSGVAVEDVKTCDAVSLTIDATPATGYELTNVVVDGVGATYSEGVISIPQGAAGTLTVTATFSQSNYTVTMEQTGDASATMSADQTNKHFNDEITVSTNEPAGYVFLGWTASPAVEFADAKALETTFNLPNGNITVTANFAKLYTVAEAIYAIDNDGVVEGVVVEGYVNNDVTASSSSYLNYYIQDVDANGFLTGTTFEAYKGKNIGNVNFKKDEGVKLGAKVRIYGNIKYYQNGDQYELDQNNYLLSYNEGTYDGVEIYGSATTTTYDAGDEFSTVGLNAKDVWDNGYAEAIAYADVEWAADPTIILTNTSSVAVTATYDNNTSAPYNVNVTVNTYAVTFDAPEYGTLVVKDGETPITSGDEFVKGTVLTVEAEPTSGYQLASLTANGDDIADPKSFTIGTADVEVVATFSQATAIDNTEVEGKAVKVLRNGVLYIEKNGKTYNAMGQLVK